MRCANRYCVSFEVLYFIMYNVQTAVLNVGPMFDALKKNNLFKQEVLRSPKEEQKKNIRIKLK